MKTIIVGGVAGGASAAARLRRLDEMGDIVLFEREEYISYANCGLPYYVGGVIPEEQNLVVQKADAFAARYRVDVRVKTEVTAIDREKKTVTARDTRTGKTVTEGYDKLVLATGARPLLPPVTGLDLPGVFTLRTVADSVAIRDAALDMNWYRAVVIGGGSVGMEVAENLVEQGLVVSVVEAADQILPQFDREMAGIIQREVRARDVDLRLGAAVESVELCGEAYTVNLSEGDPIECDFVVAAAGVRPESALAAEAGLETNGVGGIVTGADLATSDPDIYAVGDAIEVTNRVTALRGHVPLAGPANRQGRTAADNLAGGQSTYAGVLGSAVVKVFSISAACTGANERTLAAAGIPCEKLYLMPPSHANYYPGATSMAMKVLFDPESGKLLGAQCVGQAGAEKRIDVIATAMHFGGTVRDLAGLDLCYAPPFSSAKDPVNMAGLIGENIIEGRSPLKYWHDLENLDPEDTILLDVRTVREHNRGHLPDSVNIPLDELRDRLDELDRDKEIIVYCAVGQRGYLAQRILLQRGFDRVYNLSGGYGFMQTADLLQAESIPNRC